MGKKRKNNRHRYIERAYRNLVSASRLNSFNITVKETDLYVHTAVNGLQSLTKESILKHRHYLEKYIDDHPGFATVLEPVRINKPAPAIVLEMAEAGRKTGVGPMAAVAGAIAQNVGRDLLSYSNTVIIENGGDIYFKTKDPVTVAIFAGRSPLNMRIGLQVDPGDDPFSVCTSSGTVGDSLSFGEADAVCILSGSCSLADAAATAICNRIRSKKDINTGIDFGKRIKGIKGIVAIVGDRIGMWGDTVLVPIPAKKG